MQNFEKRLKYNKYMNMDNVITIDLHNNYTILSLIGKTETGNYNVEFWIRENTVDKWDLIENCVYSANIKNIYSTILGVVSAYLNEGFFDYYISRYEYELKCFDIGNEVEESKRLDGADVS